MFTKQACISRNLNEGVATFVLRIWWSIIFWIYAVWIGIKGMRTMQLGSEVRYCHGRGWTIYNWSSGPIVSVFHEHEGHRVCRKVPIEELSPVISVGEYVHRFRMMHRWWMTSWHDIYVGRRLYRNTI